METLNPKTMTDQQWQKMDVEDQLHFLCETVKRQATDLYAISQLIQTKLNELNIHEGADATIGN